MLTWFRSFVRSKVAGVLIVLLIVSFAVFGINDVFTGGPRNALATAGDKTLTPDMFERRVNSYIERLGEEQGIKSREDAAKTGLLSQLGSLLIQNLGETAYLESQGVRASPESVAAILKDVEGFRGPTGVFDPEVYRAALNRNGYTPETFEADVRDDFTLQHFEFALQAALVVPPTYAEALVRAQTDERVLRFAVLGAGDVAPVAEPDAAAIDALYAELSPSLRQPERRSVALLSLTRGDFEGTTTGNGPTPEQIAAAYEKQVAPLRANARRTVLLATFPDESQARTALAALASGSKEGFSERNLGRVEIADVEVRDAMFNAAAPGATIVDQTSDGWIAARLEAIDTSGIPRIEDLEPALRDQLGQEDANSAYNAAFDLINDAIGGGLGLPEIAAELGAGVVFRLAPVDTLGRLENGQTLNELASRPDLLADLFSRPVGEVTTPVNDPLTGGIVLAVVESVVAPSTPSLETVRSELVLLARQRALDKALNDSAQALLPSLKSGSSLNTSTGRNLPVRDVIVTRMQGLGNELPPNASDSVFRTMPGEALVHVAGRSAFLIHVVASNPASPADRAQLVPQASNALRDGLFADVRAAAGKAMMDAAKVEINQPRLAAATSPRSEE